MNMELLSVFILGEPCNTTACNNKGETCSGRLCKCGEKISCKNRVSGSYCDFANSKCKCSENTDACQFPEVCKNGRCGESLN